MARTMRKSSAGRNYVSETMVSRPRIVSSSDNDVLSSGSHVKGTRTEVRNNLTQMRVKRGIGAAQLAVEAGVSRPTIYAIEAGIYVPNTKVSLKLARALEATVEELFEMEPEQPASPVETEAIVLSSQEPIQPEQPLRLCIVDGRVIAVPSEHGGWGMSPTDAVLKIISVDKNSAKAKVQVFGDGWKSPDRILIAGCDPSASILANSLWRQNCELLITYENSSHALELLRDGLVHVAGTHLVDKTTGSTDLSQITAMFPRNSVAVISYAIWQEGLVVAHGNPKKILGIHDLARKDVRITNREPGAGCRHLLDDLLQKYGIPGKRVNGYDRVTLGHLPAARLVHSGEVDCCISTQAGARALGLEFIPLTQKPYHLVVRRKHLTLNPVRVLIETLERASFRREVEASVGYDMRTAGERIV
jgi:putative molybdopterin biosynthesis protein